MIGFYQILVGLIGPYVLCDSYQQVISLEKPGHLRHLGVSQEDTEINEKLVKTLKIDKLLI